MSKSKKKSKKKKNKPLKSIQTRKNYWIKEHAVFSGIAGAILTAIVAIIIGGNNNTFNDLKSTSGDLNIITGDNGNINKTVNNTTIVQGIPEKQYLNLAKELGVTENAVKNFFKIIEKKEVPKEDWGFTLRQIAKRHKELQSRLKQFNLLVDTEIKKLRKKAEQTINNGDYDKADNYLDEIIKRQLICADRLLKESINCKLSAAGAKVDKGDLELIRINYKAATKLFKEAVEIVPNGHELKKAEYLLKWGDAASKSGLYSESQIAYEQCLSIREKLLPKNDTKIANILNSLGLLYYYQGKYKEAEPLLQRSLEISEISCKKSS